MCDAAWCVPCTWAPMQWAVPTKGCYNKCSTFTFTTALYKLAFMLRHVMFRWSTRFQYQRAAKGQLTVRQAPSRWSQIEVCLVPQVNLSGRLHQEPCEVQSWERESLYDCSLSAVDDSAPIYTQLSTNYNALLAQLSDAGSWTYTHHQTSSSLLFSLYHFSAELSLVQCQLGGIFHNEVVLHCGQTRGVDVLLPFPWPGYVIVRTTVNQVWSHHNVC